MNNAFFCAAAATLVASVDAAKPWMDVSQTPKQRATALLAEMTLEEKISQTWSPYGTKSIGKYTKNGIGALSIGSTSNVTFEFTTFEDYITSNGNINGNGNTQTNNKGRQLPRSPAEVLQMRNLIQSQFVNQSRLHIPVSFNGECLHSGTSGGTVFPELVTQGCTWDVDLVQEIGAAIAVEARAVGVDVAFAPVINMWADSRFGRLQEGYSENPTLTAAYGAATTTGLQGVQPAGVWDYFNKSKLVALGKHYAAYGAANGGLNGGAAELSERTLREWYLRPWRAFAKAGGKGAMTSHNTILGQPAHANSYLVNDIFRKEYGFGDGVIISDCNDIEALLDFRVAANMSQAAAGALNGGVDWDLQCGGSSAYTTLDDAITAGMINTSTLDTVVLRVLQEKFALGLFDNPITDPSGLSHINSPEHVALALRAAEQGVVLLKNDGNLLPVGAPGQAATKYSAPDVAQRTVVKSIAVIGPIGDGDDSTPSLLGSYTQPPLDPNQTPSVFASLQSAFKGTVTYTKGASIETAETDGIPAAVAAAESAGLAVVVVGDSMKTCGEWGDRAELDLTGGQLALLEAVAATKTPTVLVLVTGRTATFGKNNAVLSNVSAIFSAFRPGQQGGVAIANLITGVANPSGKLAQNWVRAVGHVGSGASPWLQWRVGKWEANGRGSPDPDGRYYDNYQTIDGSASGVATPLFRLGEGMSYTTFTYAAMSATPTHGDADVSATVSVTVTNAGTVEGSEVVQVYVQDPIMTFVRPWKRLVAFKRVTIPAGQSLKVSLPITSDELAFHDDRMVLRVVPGEYTVSVGGDSVSDWENHAVVTI